MTNVEKVAIITAGGSGMGAAAGRKAEEIAATIAFLAAAGGAYITGQNIRVDGGLARSV